MIIRRVLGAPHAESTYRIVVSGELGDKFGFLFPQMRMERVGEATALIGVVRDQAQLQGLLQQVQELGLELVSVERCGADESAADIPLRVNGATDPTGPPPSS